MRIVVKMIVESDDGSVASQGEVLRLERGTQSTPGRAGLGLSLEESKQVLAAMQSGIVEAEAARIVSQASCCTDCGAKLKLKDCRHVVYRTLFGKLRLQSPRLLSCSCQAAPAHRSFSPLALALTDRSHPELQYLTTRWASIISYGSSWTLLDEILPVGTAMSCSTVRNTVRRIGQSMEDAIVEPAAADPAHTKKSRGAHRVDCGHAIAITLDAGYIRSNDRSEKGSRWFSATVARLVGTEGAGVCHGYVRKEIGFPSGRLDRFLANEGIGEATALAVISDGGEDVLGAGYFHFRASQQLLDWFHIAMRFQHLWQALGSIEQAPSNGYFTFRELLESAKWRLWHHKPVYCFSKLRYLLDQLELLPQTDAKAKAKKTAAGSDALPLPQ